MNNKDFIEIFRDNQFQNGFKVKRTKLQGSGPMFVDQLRFQNDEPPVWRLAQWHSRFDLQGTKPVQSGSDGAIVYQNAGKLVALSAGDSSAKDEGLTLEVYGKQEYDVPRKQGEPWPHLLVNQEFGNGHALKEMGCLRFRMRTRVSKCINHMDQNIYNPKLHTAQVSLFLILRNDDMTDVGDREEHTWGANPEQETGEWIWFGIPIYDYRDQTLSKGERTMWDKGTQKLIYTVPSASIWDNTLHDGKWHQADVDILPFLRRAFEVAKSKGGFTNVSFDELAIVSMNVGWEVPGTFDCAIQISELSLSKSL